MIVFQSNVGEVVERVFDSVGVDGAGIGVTRGDLCRRHDLSSSRHGSGTIRLYSAVSAHGPGWTAHKRHRRTACSQQLPWVPGGRDVGCSSTDGCDAAVKAGSHRDRACHRGGWLDIFRLGLGAAAIPCWCTKRMVARGNDSMDPCMASVAPTWQAQCSQALASALPGLECSA